MKRAPGVLIALFALAVLALAFVYPLAAPADGAGALGWRDGLTAPLAWALFMSPPGAR